jgi:hypothetical protein
MPKPPPPAEFEEFAAQFTAPAFSSGERLLTLETEVGHLTGRVEKLEARATDEATFRLTMLSFARETHGVLGDLALLAVKQGQVLDDLVSVVTAQGRTLDAIDAKLTGAKPEPAADAAATAVKP